MLRSGGVLGIAGFALYLCTYLFISPEPLIRLLI